MPVTLPPAPGPRAGQPSQAQAVWHAAVELAGGPTHDAPNDVLTLLRAAGFDPSTLGHALALGRTQMRREPDDRRLRHGRRLLVRATEWLGFRHPAGEVGTARLRQVASESAARPTSPPAGRQGP